MINTIHLLGLIVVVLVVLLVIIRSQSNESTSKTTTTYSPTSYPYAPVPNARYDSLLNLYGKSNSSSNSRSSSSNSRSSTSNSRSSSTSNSYSYSDKNIKILTYNINWKAMDGTKCNSSNDGKLCRQNVVSVIDNNAPFDFIALQEATKYKSLIDMSSTLKNMESRAWTAGGKETIVTFWNKTYGKISSYMEGYLYQKDARGDIHDQDRPYQMLFFEKHKICFINIHQGQTSENMKSVNSNSSKDLKILDMQIRTDIKYENKKKERDNKIIFQKYNSEPTILKLLSECRIIVAGDFNSDLHQLKLLGKVFKNKSSRPKTCCSDSQYDSMSYSYDHILDSKNSVEALTTCTFEYPASDHAPLIAELKR